MSKRKILIVDDSNAALKKLSQGISELGFEVLVALSAKEALSVLNQGNDVDCIISDFEMPEISGTEFVLMIKSHEEHKKTPFVMLTGSDSRENLLKAIKNGADDFISKSSTTEVIVAKINAMIRISDLNRKVSNLARSNGLRQMVATYNHEFNNPLAIIYGKLGIMKKTMTPDQIEKIKEIETQIDRIRDLVKKIDSENEFIESQYSDSTKMVNI